MNQLIEKIHFDILDDVIDSIQPFAVLYKDMIYVKDYSALKLDDLIRELSGLCNKGLMFCQIYQQESSRYQILEKINSQELAILYKNYLKNLYIPEITFDEVGYYFGITSSGKEAWEDYAVRFNHWIENEEDLWSIDEDNVKQHVIIRAKIEKVVNHLLDWWQEGYPAKQVILSTISHKSIDFFYPKYHTEIKGGYEMSFDYRTR